MQPLTAREQDLLRRAITLSEAAVANGNLPFGALFADSDGNVRLEAENTGLTENTLRHAETNLMELLVTTLEPADIAKGTLYTSCEPCAMCSGAIYWGGVNHVVYGLAESELALITGADLRNATMAGVGCEAITNSGQRTVQVRGPFLSSEAAEVHRKFW